MILLDTHALLWYTHKPDELSQRALKEIEAASRAIIYVSAASLWEIALKVNKGQLPYELGIPGYRNQIYSLGYISILPVDEWAFMDAAMMEFPHRDPVDRILIATAKRRKLKLVSCDPQIKKAYKKTVW
ncbi:MAG: type II toxin-antitoxin system VapC family toxin [Spirochaetes bacterium]|nr:type II toxin-antitoxin system VapC family toxin [Spirochaetota bacterium]